jgi:hypothetical protein
MDMTTAIRKTMMNSNTTIMEQAFEVVVVAVMKMTEEAIFLPCLLLEGRQESIQLIKSHSQ